MARVRLLLAALCFGVLLAGILAPNEAGAQAFDFAAEADPDAKMLLEADTLVYETRTDRVSARGNVFIAYRGYQVFANSLTYDQRTRILTAYGGVRLEEPDGNIVMARTLVLSDEMVEGFAEGLRADTIFRTRLAANRATREGEVTVFEDAVYTACYTCRRRPDRPTKWAIKSRTVTYDESEKVLRFERPEFDLFGNTVAVLPSFSIPDPTLRRKSGFLTPTFVVSNKLGFGARVPYFQTLGPSADVTFGVTPLSRQGVLGDATYRQRTASGAFEVRGAGIYQLDPGAFAPNSGDREFRGSLTSFGEFYINPRWRYGWDITATTDRSFLGDYQQPGNEELTAENTVFLTGLGERNYFDARLWAFRILQEDFISQDVLDPPAPFTPFGSDLQGKQAYVHPVIDYEGVYDGNVLGGELSYALNTTWLSRGETDAFGAVVGGVLTPRFRGVEGTYGRLSGEVNWRKRIMAPLGQVVTPFAGVRGDLFSIDNRDENVDVFTDEDIFLRGMPHAGIEYRWPWLIAAGWGTQVLEPVAEIIARPDEEGIGRLPNEDAQSVVFDDTNLFGPTKFSGFDRAEGGIRANVGVRYTAQTYSGGFLSATFGQSYHLAGRNSYRDPDILDSASLSGLDTDRSDLVGALYLDTNGGLAISAKARFDDKDFRIRRTEVGAAARVGPLSSQVVYAFIGRQPDLGLIDAREEIYGSASLRILDSVRVFANLRYDIDDSEVIRDGIGVAYDDDSFSISLAYSEDRGGEPFDPVDRTVFFRFGLRTIGDATASTGLDD